MFTEVDTNLMRGPRPTSKESLSEIQMDLNLEEGWFEFFHGIVAQESGWCGQLGILFVHQPMSDVWRPSVAQINQILKLVEYGRGKGYKVLVHCLHGEDRTGIIIAAYRIVYQAWPVERAIAEMYAMGFHKFPYFYWVSVLNKLAPLPLAVLRAAHEEIQTAPVLPLAAVTEPPEGWTRHGPKS